MRSSSTSRCILRFCVATSSFASASCASLCAPAADHSEKTREKKSASRCIFRFCVTTSSVPSAFCTSLRAATYMWHDSFTCVTRLIYKSFTICVTAFTRTCDMTQLHVYFQVLCGDFEFAQRLLRLSMRTCNWFVGEKMEKKSAGRIAQRNEISSHVLRGLV